MKLRHAAFCFFSCFASPLLAQPTTIGGGNCSSATLNGAYAVTVSGRGFNGTGNLVSIFQAIGYATFDGLSKATFNLTADTNQGIGSTVTWLGTYSVQVNCVATLTIASGGNANFNMAWLSTRPAQTSS